MRKFALLLAIPFLLGAAPLPRGQMTLVSTDPVTIAVEYNHRIHPDKYLVFITLYCSEVYDGYTEEYLAYDVARESPVVFDEDVWVLYYGDLPEGDCHAYLQLFVRKSGLEYVLDDIYFEAT